MLIVPQNAVATPAKNRLERPEVLGKPPVIANTSRTICTLFISRVAPLCWKLDCNLCPTLTAHSEPLPFSELAETRVQASCPYLRRVLG